MDAEGWCLVLAQAFRKLLLRQLAVDLHDAGLELGLSIPGA